MAISNNYSVLFTLPVVQKKRMNAKLERLAESIVKNGKLRISADTSRNFVVFSLLEQGFSTAFSKKELTDSKLLLKTKKQIQKIYANFYTTQSDIQSQTEKRIKQLQAECKKLTDLPKDKEIKLARVLVQCADISVIKLLIKEETEIFISYSHNIEDLVHISEWETLGQAGGLQRTEGPDTSIYISCMGDPFLPEENRTYTTDGFPALARMVVIAGQELGHFADIKRNDKKSKFSRFSCINVHKPDPKVSKARKKDLANTKKIIKQIKQLGIRKLFRIDSEIEFLKKHRKRSRLHISKLIQRFFTKLIITRHAKKYKVKFITDFPKKLCIENKMVQSSSTHIKMAAEDMLFNLEPRGYDQENKEAEEAVLCAEALARIPQQALKWGHKATRIAMPNLYRIYYDIVVVACQKTLNAK